MTRMCSASLCAAATNAGSGGHGTAWKGVARRRDRERHAATLPIGGHLMSRVLSKRRIVTAIGLAVVTVAVSIAVSVSPAFSAPDPQIRGGRVV